MGYQSTADNALSSIAARGEYQTGEAKHPGWFVILYRNVGSSDGRRERKTCR